MARRTVDHLHRVVKAYVLLFMFWGVYRLLIRLPAEIEETVLKPLVFVGSVLWVERPRSAVAFFRERWGNGDSLRAIMLGTAVGVGYLALYAIASIVSFGSLRVGSQTSHALWLSVLFPGVLTSIWEEWAFTGYFLGEFGKILRHPWISRLLASGLFTLTYLPILLFWYQFTGSVLLFQALTMFVLGFVNATLMAVSKNLLAPVLSHTLWGVAVVLMR